MTYRATWFMFITLMVLNGCATNPIYLTKAKPTESMDVFMMPYYTKVDSRVAISIASLKDKDGKVVNNTLPIITVGAINQPKDKRYLYFHDDMWFNNSAEFHTNNIGYPTKSDTSSVQQVIPMLTALGQAAGQIMALGGKAMMPTGLKETEVETQNNFNKLKANCDKAFSEVVAAPLPFYSEIRVSDVSEMNKDLMGANLVLNSLIKTTERGLKFKIKIDPEGEGRADAIPKAVPFEGYVLYEQSSITASLVCEDDSQIQLYLGTSPLIPVYRDRLQLNPQRAFWKNPTDTITSDNGIITGHKYTNQSPAKTFVDLITAPVRALLPSTTNTTTTSVVTVPGKPDQTTSTTQQQTGPPK